jgi:hypothetical protein
MLGSMMKFKKGEFTNLKSINPVKMLITHTRVGRDISSVSCTHEVFVEMPDEKDCTK